MSIEMLLSVASFVLSLFGLIPVFILKDRKKEISIAAVVSALVLTTGLGLYLMNQHEKLITRVEREIIEELSHETWTFEQIYEKLHYVPFSIVNEALFRAVESDLIGHRVLELRDNDGTMQRVRGYFVESQP